MNASKTILRLSNHLNCRWFKNARLKHTKSVFSTKKLHTPSVFNPYLEFKANFQQKSQKYPIRNFHNGQFLRATADSSKNSESSVDGSKKLPEQAYDALQRDSDDKSKPPEEQGQQQAEGDNKSVVDTVKKYIFMRRDRTKRYTDNNTITAVRAMQEYILKPSDLKDLPQLKVRSPYRDGKGHLLVYLENDVINKAMEVHGSEENLKLEQKRIKKLKDKQRQYLDWASATEEVAKSATQIQKSFFTSGAGRVVAVAAVSNAVICAFKCACWLWTGSASMFSETLHSFADMCNQVLLLWGVYQSTKTADAEHPYGFGNMRYIVSLISGVGIFCIGCGVSVYHGISCMITGGGGLDNITSLGTLGVLAGSALVESASLIVAIDETRHNASKQNMSFWSYVKTGQDPSTNVVLLEDSCAVLGVGIAALALLCTQYMNNPIYDHIGSTLIGGLLGVVATFLVRSNAEALVGQSIPQDELTELREHLEDDVIIRGVYDIKATQIGYGELKFKAEIDFDGREVTRVYLEKNDMEKLQEEIKAINSPKQLEVFLLNHGEAIIDTLGSQVDRLEVDLKKKNKDLRHIDLEVL